MSSASTVGRIPVVTCSPHAYVTTGRATECTCATADFVIKSCGQRTGAQDLSDPQKIEATAAECSTYTKVSAVLGERSQSLQLLQEHARNGAMLSYSDRTDCCYHRRPCSRHIDTSQLPCSRCKTEVRASCGGHTSALHYIMLTSCRIFVF